MMASYPKAAVDMPKSNTILVWTPILQWYVVSVDLKQITNNKCVQHETLPVSGTISTLVEDIHIYELHGL